MSAERWPHDVPVYVECLGYLAEAAANLGDHDAARWFQDLVMIEAIKRRDYWARQVRDGEVIVHPGTPKASEMEGSGT